MGAQPPPSLPLLCLGYAIPDKGGCGDGGGLCPAGHDCPVVLRVAIICPVGIMSSTGGTVFDTVLLPFALIHLGPSAV